MSQEPGMIEQRWDVGVEAAYAANQAVDLLVAATARRKALAEVVIRVDTQQLDGGVTIDDSFTNELNADVDQAKQDYEAFSGVVGQMIGRDVLGNDYSNEDAVEPVSVPEIDEATAEKLETLPAEMKEQVGWRYTQTYHATEANIREGKLPESYRLPELSEFVEGIVALAPTFEKIQELGGTPAVEFFERGLSDEQASATLTGLKLPDGQESAGVYRTFSKDKLTTPEGTAQPNVGFWGVVVVDVSEKPAIRGISKDGKNAIDGVNAKEVIKTLKRMPDVTETKDTEVIAQASPSEAAYRGVQRRRRERGETPLDVERWTIGKENVNYCVGSAYSAFFRWCTDGRQVRSSYGSRGSASDDYVVRVSGER